MDANDTNGRRFFDFADRIVTELVGITSFFVAIDNIEDLTNRYGNVSTSAYDVKPLTRNMNKAIYYEHQLFICHSSYPIMRELNHWSCSSFSRCPAL